MTRASSAMGTSRGPCQAWLPKCIAMLLVLQLSLRVSCHPAAVPTWSVPAQISGTANITALLQRVRAEHQSNDSLLTADNDQSEYQAALLGRRQNGVIGTGICATAMQGFTCDMSHHEQNRCAGDDYSYCICAGGASLPNANPEGLWLNTAWGPGCYACYGSSRGQETDGTCNGNGGGGRGQSIPEILATLTITITRWTSVTLPTPGPTRGRDDNPPRNPATTKTAIVTVTKVAGSSATRSEQTAGRWLGLVLSLLAVVVGSFSA